MLLNSDVIARRGWLEILQHGAYEAGGERVGVTGAKLLYKDDSIQFAGAIRNPDAPEWFDHRFRFRAADDPAADVMQAVLGVTGACMYITRDTLDEVGLLDEAYGMAYEDMDYCLRVWESGRRVVYMPGAQLTHYESKTRGLGVQGERELASQKHFWEHVGRLVRRARRHRPRRRAADHLRHPGRRRRGRPPRRLRAPRRAAGPRPPPGAVDARRRPAGLVRPARPGALVPGLPGALARAGAGRGDQGRDVVGDRPAGLGGLGRRAASRSTSSRTSRRPTTRRTPSSTAASTRATARSSPS